MRTRTVISTITLAAAVLAGCSDEPVPKEPDGTASTSPTPISTESPPPLPEQATENSAEGAAAFLDHYLDVMNYASHTGDVAPLQALSLDTCSGCQKYIDHYLERLDAGGSRTGGEWSVDKVEIEQIGDEVFLVAAIAIAAGEQAATATDDALPFAATAEDVTFAAIHSGDEWTMTQMAPGRQL
jgi:hypothetical protein